MHLKECEICKASITLVEEDGREVAYDRPDGELHECLAVPENADLLVIED